MEFEDIDKAPVWRLKIITKTSDVPALARSAATRLYELGERKYAVDFLIKQMNLYKLPRTHQNIISETCPEAAKELGRLGDERAVEPLFEALNELGFGPAIGLARHNDVTIEERLVRLVQYENKVAVFAAISLGYMKNQAIVPKLICMLEHHKEYETIIDDKILRLRRELVLILGAYQSCTLSEQSFRKEVDKNDVDWILMSYLHQNKYPSQRWLEWDIVNKYGWDNYVKSETEKFPFRHSNVERWKEYSGETCPFKSDSDVIRLREEILESILAMLPLIPL